ncbi:MAG: hypothetical protein KGZ75_03635 [Syntrophomonadaceae bacterium]|jgi:uncharacterized protein YoxC|nr:hypothetical protein [Syntrophomonadaceae bacterium]
MLEMVVSIWDLGIFLLFVALMAALIYLTVALKKLSDFLSVLNRVIADNEKALEEIASNAAEITGSMKKSAQNTEDVVPEIIRNVQSITASVNNSVKNIDSSITTVGSSITQTVTAVKNSADNIGTYITIAQEVAQFVMGIIERARKRKKRIWN